MDFDTSTIPIYVVGHGEVPIAAPVEKVWPLLVDYASWQNYSRQEHVFGEPGGVGEVVILKKDEAGSSGNPYFARTVFVEPGRRIVWKVFHEGSDYFGIVDFKADATEGGSVFTYDVLYEYVLPATDDAELEAFRREREAGLATMSTTIFPKLKALAENGA